jgi:hypothetical protein
VRLVLLLVGVDRFFQLVNVTLRICQLLLKAGQIGLDMASRGLDLVRTSGVLCRRLKTGQHARFFDYGLRRALAACGGFPPRPFVRSCVVASSL